MSWQNNIENIVFTIITGDGKEWTPKWRNAVKEVEYNSSIFEFVNVAGSLVLRQKPKGRKFDLEFYFDGENAITEGNNFEISARDNRFWKLKHPFYGDIKCQPLSIKQDNSALNVSKFTVPVIETITNAYPERTKIVIDEIKSRVATLNVTQQVALLNSKELDKVELTNNVNYLKAAYEKIITTGAELKEFEDLCNSAFNEIANAFSTAQTILREIQRIINYPATIIQTLENRYKALKETLDGIKNSFGGNKHQYEAIAGSILSSMYIASTTNTDEYITRKYVTDQQARLLIKHNEYLLFLDGLQTDRSDNPNSYTPDFDAMNQLNELANLTIANLFEVAFSARQEREYILEYDSNAILLTHRFYGLDGEDLNLGKFINTNNIGINEILNIRKGRKIVYYV